ncbi:hypothetical protein [Actinomadura sp. B10D3]
MPLVIAAPATTSDSIRYAALLTFSLRVQMEPSGNAGGSLLR